MYLLSSTKLHKPKKPKVLPPKKIKNETHFKTKKPCKKGEVRQFATVTESSDARRDNN